MRIPDYIKQLANDATTEFTASRDFYSQINEERSTNLSYYMQLPLGNESKGFSQFITSDVRDTVDFYISNIMEMFYGGDAPIRFNPMNAKDVGQAEIETKYVKHVIEEQNDGFTTLFTWFKDALIQKNGIVKVYWDDKIDEQPENYENKSYEQYAKTISDADYEVKKVKISSPLFEGEFTPDEFSVRLEEFGPDGQAVLQSALFHIYGFRKKDISQVRIENVEPEYFVVSSTWANLKVSDADYCGHIHYYSKNELLADGYDYDMVMALPTGSIDTSSMDTAIRYTKEAGRLVGASAATRSGELVEVIEHYIRDSKSNGEPKTYCITTAANGSVILDWYEVDKAPYHVITPKINPYRFFGDALADELIDVQYARSNLWRSSFDNIKYTVSPRWSAKGDVDLEALNDYTPTGIVPMGVDGEVNALITPFVADKAMEMSALLENMRAERTGFSRETMGLDPAALAQSTNFIGSTILNLSQMRIKMVASTFANTGFKSLCEHVRELLMKHESQEKVFEVAGKFMTVSPREWFKNRSTTVKTGLGHAGKMELVNSLQGVLQLQEKLSVAQGGFMGPIVTLDNVYAAIARTAEASGIRDPGTFFTNPEGYEPPPPEKPLAEKQLESFEKVEIYKVDVNAQTQARKIEADASMEKYKTDENVKVKNNELVFKYQEALKADQNHDRDKADSRREKALSITVRE
jgi:hypothetical protein